MKNFIKYLFLFFNSTSYEERQITEISWLPEKQNYARKDYK